jgi:Flp pilus assembly pilin Flp
MKAIIRFARDENGVISIEYSLIAVIISIVMISSLNSMANSLNTMFAKATSGIGSK